MVSKKDIKVISIVLGTIFIIIGLVFNIISSDISVNSVNIELEPGEHNINEFNSNLNPDEYGLNIQVYGTFYQTSNTSILFLNNTEYQKYLGGEDISNLTTFLEINGTYNPSMNQLDFQKTFSIFQSHSFTILVENGESSTINGYYAYFYSITTPFYYYGLILMIIGALVSLSTASWYFTDWRRYMILGAEVNAIFFLIRIGIFSTLPQEFNMLSLGNFFDIEIYRDFEYYYCIWGEIFRDGNLIFSGAYGGYTYGPLFMLTLGLFSLIPMPLWSMALPLFFSTVGIGYLVYKISKKITNNEKYGIYAMLLYFLNPFTFLYSSFGWLNPSLFVFFIVLTFYLIIEHKYGWAILSLVISTMFKQFAIIFVPIVLILIIRMKEDSKLFKKVKNFLLYGFTYIGIILLISLPYLILNFNIYVQKFILGGTNISFEYLTTFYQFPGAMVHFNTFFLSIGAPEVVTTVVALLLQYYILLGACFLGIALYFLIYSPKKTNDYYKKELYVLSLFLSLLTILSFHLFYPRGSFKYYFILLAPFISILFGAEIRTAKSKEFRFKAIYLIPTIISWIVFFFNRYLYFWVILGWMIEYIILIYFSLKNANSLPISPFGEITS